MLEYVDNLGQTDLVVFVYIRAGCCIIGPDPRRVHSSRYLDGQDCISKVDY